MHGCPDIPVDWGKLRAEQRLVVYYGDEELLDEATATLLYYVRELGSLLKASRKAGIPYSRAWERIARIERVLGTRLLARRRGGSRGGGAELTPEGARLLEYYESMYRRIHGRPFTPASASRVYTGQEVIVSGSHDFIVSRAVGVLRESGHGIELHWTGSTHGLAALVLGEADVVGIHLLDPQTGAYNTHVYERLGLSGEAVLLRGYDRAQGFITRKPMGFEEVMEGLASGRLVLANRQPGSGTRLLLDSVLGEWASRRGLSLGELRARIRGYGSSYTTHLEVAEAVARGDADVGVGLLYAARVYGLEFVLLAWERYDFLVGRGFYGSERGEWFLRGFFEAVSSVGEGLEGYRILPGIGGVLRA